MNANVRIRYDAWEKIKVHTMQHAPMALTQTGCASIAQQEKHQGIARVMDELDLNLHMKSRDLLYPCEYFSH